MTLFVGLLSIGAAVTLLGYTLLNRRTATAGGPGGDMPVNGVPLGPPVTSESALRRMLVSVAARATGKNYAAKAQAKLNRAGNPVAWDAQRLLAAKGAGLLGGVAVGLLMGAKWGGIWTLVVPVLLGLGGLFAPDVLIRNLGEHRQEKLLRGLPDGIDMMTVCVEAGLGFDAALGRVARNLPGPFAEECARVLQEMQIGSSRAQALRAMIERTDVAELRTFVTAIVQSSELGISIGDVLREQSHQMRVKRRQRAEEKAQKLQVKLLFPLITCLLPSMFIVILGPAMMQIMQFFQQSTN